jgi:hypothetical protein
VANGLKRRGDHTTATGAATSNGATVLAESRSGTASAAAAVVNEDGGWLHDDFDR